MYRIRLEEFEGPLDLLLFLIQREEIDIFDIPIAHITDEYLAHVRLLEFIDLDGVADFLYLASLLIAIKVRMLLPRPVLEAEGEPVDPRQELVERLLEYRRFKEAAQKLKEQQEQRAAHFTRGEASASSFAEAPEDLVNTTIYDLISALRRVLVDAPDEPTLAITSRDYSIEEQRRFVLQAVEADGAVAFTELMRLRSKQFVITTFLAILEMARRGQIVIVAAPSDDDFIIEQGPADE